MSATAATVDYEFHDEVRNRKRKERLKEIDCAWLIKFRMRVASTSHPTRIILDYRSLVRRLLRGIKMPIVEHVLTGDRI